MGGAMWPDAMIGVPPAIGVDALADVIFIFLAVVANALGLGLGLGLGGLGLGLGLGLICAAGA